MNIKVSLSSRLVKVFIYLIFIIISLSAIIPFILAAIVSFTDEKAVILQGYRFFPSKWSLNAYKLIFEGGWVFDAYKVTLFVTIVGTVLCIVVSSMLGYAISLKKVKYRNSIAMFLFIPMVFNAGLLPWYVWVTRVLHLRNNLFGLILPIMINPFWIFLMRNYFKSIPESLSEAAEIDGAGPIYRFFKIIFPLSKPILATITLFAVLMYWNDFTMALWLISKQELYPLQFVLYRIQAEIQMAADNPQLAALDTGIIPTETARMATFIVVLGPIVLVYPFVQKYFVKGIMIGAVKG